VVNPNRHARGTGWPFEHGILNPISACLLLYTGTAGGVVILRNPHFTGREGELGRLADTLAAQVRIYRVDPNPDTNP